MTFAQFGIEARSSTATILRNFASAIRDNTKAVYVETIGNPQLNVADLAAIAQIAHDAGVPLVVDNTLASPYLCRPFEHGADIVIHSVTKYLGGHGTTMGGIVVESGKFPWDNGRFPQMTEPSRGYHGVIFLETFGDFGFTMKARMEMMRTLGPTLSPFSAFLLLQGIETLHLRMPRHCESALAVARHLAAHPAVEWVDYPGLRAKPLPRAARSATCRTARAASSPSACGRRRGGRQVHRERAVPVAPRQRRRREDARDPPASTTHRQLSEDEQRAAGVVAGNDPPVGRARGAGRYPVGPRPGARALAELKSHYDCVTLQFRGRWPASSWPSLLVARTCVQSLGAQPAARRRWRTAWPRGPSRRWRRSPCCCCRPAAPAYFLGFLVCAGLMGWALYLQYGLDLEPCPLCVFQRVAVMATGAVFLVAAIHNPRRAAARVLRVLTLVTAGIGAALAAWHVWIQAQPKG